MRFEESGKANAVRYREPGDNGNRSVLGLRLASFPRRCIQH